MGMVVEDGYGGRRWGWWLKMVVGFGLVDGGEDGDGGRRWGWWLTIGIVVEDGYGGQRWVCLSKVGMVV